MCIHRFIVYAAKRRQKGIYLYRYISSEVCHTIHPTYIANGNHSIETHACHVRGASDRTPT